MSSGSAETPATASGALDRFESEGFLRLRSVLSAAEVEAALPALEQCLPKGAAGSRVAAEKAAPVRAWLRHEAIRGGLRHAGLHEPFPVRVILFDKTPEANWGVPWHQDLAVAVRRRVEVPGFLGWSTKEGRLHVHPPSAVLEAMATLRIALDACGSDDGPLRVLPGSHRSGRLPGTEIEAWKRRVAPVDCTAGIGDAVLMRPLLLHASRPAAVPRRRRVLHVEWADRPLPGGLEWASLGIE